MNGYHVLYWHASALCNAHVRLNTPSPGRYHFFMAKLSKSSSFMKCTVCYLYLPSPSYAIEPQNFLFLSDCNKYPSINLSPSLPWETIQKQKTNEVYISLYTFFFFKESACLERLPLHNSGWPQICYISQAGLELIILLSQLPDYWLQMCITCQLKITVFNEERNQWGKGGLWTWTSAHFVSFPDSQWPQKSPVDPRCCVCWSGRHSFSGASSRSRA